MCEHCDDPRVNWEETEPVAHDDEWTCDGDEGPCGEQAAWRTAFGYVDDHYCDEHKNEKGEPALLELREPDPGYRGDGLLPIRAVETCAGPLLGGGCANPARWARITLAQSFTCRRHREGPPAGTPPEVAP